MYYILTRMEFVISFLLAALVTWLIVFVPPYEKWVYEKTPAVSQADIENKNIFPIGYKAGEGIPVARTYDEMRTDEQGWIYFTMEISSNQLIPTGIYRKVEDSISEYETNKRKVALYRNRYIYAQFYILTLEDGKKIPILLNDNGMELKKDAILKLPICHFGLGYGLDEYYYERGCDRSIVENLYGVDDYDLFIDAISYFANGEEMKKFRSNQTTAAIIVFLVVLFGSVTLLFLISKAMGKNNK